MVILITGASHTGKTVLAQRMLEKYQYPYLSVDHLKMGLIRSGNTKLTPKDDDKLTEYLWPIVREDLRHPLPDFVTKADFDWAVEEAARKKKTDFSKAEFLTYDEVCAFNACM